MASGEDDEWLNFSLYRMAEMKMSVKKLIQDFIQFSSAILREKFLVQIDWLSINNGWIILNKFWIEPDSRDF